MVRRASKLNGERRTVEMLAFRQVINEVEDHPRSLHERQFNDDVDGDVWTCCDHKR